MARGNVPTSGTIEEVLAMILAEEENKKDSSANDSGISNSRISQGGGRDDAELGDDDEAMLKISGEGGDIILAPSAHRGDLSNKKADKFADSAGGFSRGELVSIYAGELERYKLIKCAFELGASLSKIPLDPVLQDRLLGSTVRLAAELTKARGIDEN